MSFLRERLSRLHIGMNSRESQSIEPEKIIRLNDLLLEGTPLYVPEVLQTLRAIPKPILVDLNGVLLNNLHPIQPNPAARGLLHLLGEFGQVIILTTSSDWKKIQELLLQHRLWTPQTIMINDQNFSFLGTYGSQEAVNIYREYIEMKRAQGVNVSFDALEGSSTADKRVAPIFMRPFPIPLIDDSPAATTDRNPGIRGIRVVRFNGKNESGLPETEKRNGDVSLGEAINAVRTHYEKLA